MDPRVFLKDHAAAIALSVLGGGTLWWLLVRPPATSTTVPTTVPATGPTPPTPRPLPPLTPAQTATPTATPPTPVPLPPIVRAPATYTLEPVTIIVPAPRPSTPIPRTPPPAPPTTPSAGPSGPDAAILSECFQRTNAARAAGHQCADSSGYNPPRPALRWNATLARVAQAHSNWMAANHILSHQDPTGDPGQRVTAAGYAWAHVAENVASGAQTPQVAVDGWLASHEGHCDNIMSPKSSEIGIGVARASDGTMYWTQEFAGHR